MADQFSDPPRPFRRDMPHIGERPKPGPKRAVNLSVDAAILEEAKAMKINLSQALEDDLRRRTKAVREQKWREEHREALDSYNRLIERAGVFGEELLDLDDDPPV
ncbi:MAG TPA: type II toxin-antitoxin system CcdA family antitoxin [Rhizomicrobium sp.]